MGLLCLFDVVVSGLSPWSQSQFLFEVSDAGISGPYFRLLEKGIYR